MTSVEGYTAMPELGEFVPELLCLGVDLVICGVLYKVGLVVVID